MPPLPESPERLLVVGVSDRRGGRQNRFQRVQLLDFPQARKGFYHSRPPKRDIVARVSHKTCGEGGSIFTPAGPRDCLRFMTLGWTSNERSATEKLFAPRLEGFLRAQLPHHATPLAARFRPGPFRRSVCFLDGADDVFGLVRRDQAVKSWDALAVAFLWARFWFSDVSPLT